MRRHGGANKPEADNPTLAGRWGAWPAPRRPMCMLTCTACLEHGHDNNTQVACCGASRLAGNKRQTHVRTCRWFVQEQHLGVPHQRNSHTQAPLHAARIGPRPHTPRARQLHTRQQLGRSARHLRMDRGRWTGGGQQQQHARRRTQTQTAKRPVLAATLQKPEQTKHHRSVLATAFDAPSLSHTH